MFIDFLSIDLILSKMKGDKVCYMFKNIKKYPIFYFIIFIQIIFVLILFTKACILPKKVIFANIDSSYIDGENVYTKYGKVSFVNKGNIDDNNRINIKTENLFLPQGAYNLYILYNTDDCNINNKNLDNHIIANLTVESKFQIKFDQMLLYNQNNISSGKLWIPGFIFYKGCDDFKINISYNGNGKLSISDIKLIESLPYRFIEIIGIAISLFIIDLILCFLFTNLEICIKKSYSILFLIIIIASFPFFQENLFGGHDIGTHLLRIVSLSEELKNWQFPVRIATKLNGGYGYPWSIYYCDIFLYPVAILYTMSVPLGLCYQIYVILINIATTVFTYLSLSKFTKKTSLKLLGTGLYVLCIYRLTNINVRSALGEYTAMTFLPLVLTGLYLVYTKEKLEFKDWLYLTLGISGIIMSHILTVEMVIINIFLLSFLLFKKTFKKNIFLSLVKSIFLSFGITAWFLIPFMDYYLHHVTIVQKSDLSLLKDSTVDLIFIFQMFSPGKGGWWHWTNIGMPLVLGIVIIFYCIIKYKKFGHFKEINFLILISGFAFLNIIFVTKYFPWMFIQNYFGLDGIGHQIGNIQFAWRFLGIASLLLVFAIVIALNIIYENDLKILYIFVFSLVWSIIISVGFFYYKYTDEIDSAPYNTMSPYSKSDSLYLLDETGLYEHNFALPEIILGNVSLSNYEKTNLGYKMYVENKDSTVSIVSMPIYNYRYFNAYDENNNFLDKEVVDSDCITINIPAFYKGEIIAKFEPPYLWRLSEFISLVSIILVFLKLINNKKIKKIAK